MNEAVIKIIAGVIGTLGFTILFNLRIKHIPYAVTCGLIAGVVYFLVFGITDNYFISNISAAFVMGIFAEVFARIAKAPATVFLIPGSILLVPGGSLYYSMSYLISQKFELAGEQLLLTVEVGIAIGGGLIASSLIMYIILHALDFFKERKHKSKSHIH